MHPAVWLILIGPALVIAGLILLAVFSRPPEDATGRDPIDRNNDAYWRDR